MIYSNPEFFVFFGFVLIAFFGLPGYWARFCTLLGSSLFFYAWSGAFDTLIFVSVVVISWLATYAAFKFPKRRGLFLSIGITIMLLHLFFWKYAPWLTKEIQKVFPHFLGGKALALALPVGISFFTLQSIAYMIDFRRGELGFIPFHEYALFKSFFPQLVAGPIVRVPQLLPQIKLLRLPRWKDIEVGAGLFAMGFFKKVVLADHMAPRVDEIFSSPALYDRSTLVCGALAYTIQIWGDFSGYTDMGRGCAQVLGIQLPENFLSPYLSKSPSEFWKRWHITLSLWIRDYIYIPLVKRMGVRSLAALITMLISGLWHGANWTFLLWGLYHGLLLLLENIYRGFFKENPQETFLGNSFSRVLTLLLVVIGWVLFRSSNISVFLEYLRFTVSGAGQGHLAWGGVTPACVVTAIVQLVLFKDLKSKGSWLNPRAILKFAKGETLPSDELDFWGGVRFFGALFVIYSIAIYFRPSAAPSFIYFQF